MYLKANHQFLHFACLQGIDTVTLGGCRQFESLKEEVDKYDSAAIWERCTDMLPNLKSAEIVREVAGLRPHRTPVRVEKDVHANRNGKRLKVNEMILSSQTLKRMNHILTWI